MCLDKPYIIAGPIIIVNDSDKVIISREIKSNHLSNASRYSGPELLKTESSVKNATFIIEKVECTDSRNFTLLASNAVTHVTALMELIINCKYFFYLRILFYNQYPFIGK